MNFLIIAICLVVFDQLSKFAISTLISPGESVIVFEKFFNLTLVHNTGIAFGMFKDQTLIFISVSIIAIGLILFNVYFQRQHKYLNRLEVIAFSLILGGAIGNLIDRLRFGYVVDFLDFRIWPVFNIADSAITIGVAILLIRCIPFSSK